MTFSSNRIAKNDPFKCQKLVKLCLRISIVEDIYGAENTIKSIKTENSAQTLPKNSKTTSKKSRIWRFQNLKLPKMTLSNVKSGLNFG